MPKIRTKLPSSFSLEPKRFFLLVLLAINMCLYVVLSGTVKSPLTFSTSPWNYKFAFYKDNKIGIYDMQTNEISEVPVSGKRVLQFGWSKDAQLAFKNEDFDLSLIKNNQIKKLASGMKGYFFWKDDNSGIYAANYEPTGYVEGGNWQKTYFITSDGKQAEIPVTTYEKTEGEQVTKENNNTVASYDSKFMSHTNYTDPNASRISLVDTKNDKTYSLPSKSKVKVSGGESFVGFTQGDGYRELVIFPFSNVVTHSFRNPLFEKNEVRDYAWINDSKLVLVYENAKLINSSYSFDYIYELVNVKTNEEKVIYTIKDSDQGIADVYISPDGKRVAFREEETSGTAKSITHKSFLVVINIQDVKELQRIPFDVGAWSNPIR